MESFEQLKNLVVNFKLDYCCWIIPVRIGLIFAGYFNIIIAIISLIGTANESFPPIIVQVQAVISEDNMNKPLPIVCYAIELGFSFLLLCAIYRKDIILLRVYMKYCFAAIILSFLVYSMVIGVIDLLIQIIIIFSMAYQFYVIMLVRSTIVELRLEKKKYDLPTLVMSSVLQDKEGSQNGESKDALKDKDDTTVVVTATDTVAEEDKPLDVETTPEAGPVNNTNILSNKKEIKEVKLETVNEHPKE